MKKVLNWSIGLLLGLCLSIGIRAQLTLEKSVPAALAEQYIEVMPHDELNSYVALHGVTYEYRDDPKMNPLPPILEEVTFGRTSFAWRFRSDDVYYTHVFAFRPNVEPPPLCRDDAPEEKKMGSRDCEKAVEYFRQCHLFVMNVDRKIQAVLPLNIPQPDFIDGKPGCLDVHGMAPAQVVKDGMLIVVGYYDSRWICSGPGPQCASGRRESYPDPYYKTTLLVRFDKSTNGKLVLSQDDKCLLPLNKYNTIASARAALKEAGCK